MMTVSQLRTLLEQLPDNAPIATIAVTEAGIGIDHLAAEIVGVDCNHPDDGRGPQAWITAVLTANTPQQPPFISWPCRCGEQVITSQDADIPYEHLGHLDA